MQGAGPAGGAVVPGEHEVVGVLAVDAQMVAVAFVGQPHPQAVSVDVPVPGETGLDGGDVACVGGAVDPSRPALAGLAGAVDDVAGVLRGGGDVAGDDPAGLPLHVELEAAAQLAGPYRCGDEDVAVQGAGDPGQPTVDEAGAGVEAVVGDDDVDVTERDPDAHGICTDSGIEPPRSPPEGPSGT